MEVIIELVVTVIICFIVAKLIALYIESKSIRNSPMCEHYGEPKKYVFENDMWMCKECENKFKKDVE